MTIQLALRSTLTVLISLAVALASAGESDEKKKEEKAQGSTKSPYMEAVRDKQVEKADEVKVYTNEDLGKLSGRGVSQSPVDTKSQEKPEKWDPLQQMQDEKTAESERDAAAVEAETKVLDAENRVKNLEDRLRKLRNPLLARPSAPEDQEDWKDIGTAERVERTQAELEEARKELDAARGELSGSR